MLAADLSQNGLAVPSFQVDPTFTPMPVTSHPEMAAELDAAGQQVVIMRGTIDADKIDELKRQPDVIDVHPDVRIAPFNAAATVRGNPRRWANPRLVNRWLPDSAV